MVELATHRLYDFQNSFNLEASIHLATLSFFWPALIWPAPNKNENTAAAARPSDKCTFLLPPSSQEEEKVGYVNLACLAKTLCCPSFKGRHKNAKHNPSSERHGTPVLGAFPDARGRISPHIHTYKTSPFEEQLISRAAPYI